MPIEQGFLLNPILIRYLNYYFKDVVLFATCTQRWLLTHFTHLMEVDVIVVVTVPKDP